MLFRSNGVIWLYMGADQANPPALPMLEANMQDDGNWTVQATMQECNYMQVLEGDIDTCHLYFLHGRLNADDPAQYGVFHKDKAPRLEIVETEYGVLYGAKREEEEGKTYWRTTQYLMPIFTMFPGTEDGFVPSHMYTPIDDNLTLHWGLRWHPTKAFQHDRKLVQQVAKVPEYNGMGPMKPKQHGRPFADWWCVAELGNDFLMDREVQKTKNYTGIPTIRLQDAAVIVTMGPIYDRTQEHLGTTDAMIIRVDRKSTRLNSSHT